jgi:succinate dehydrogenase / fumarate reductase cytochrome b subunit
MANAASSRPVSPHLQVWRWHITMFGSIVHRATGVILYLGAIGLVVWLCLIAAGPTLYDKVLGLVPPWMIYAKLYAVTAVIAYHLVNGIRHLLWDIGWGFQKSTANATGWLVILLALAAPLGLYALTVGVPS